jgi:hypothetical protein
LRIGVNAVKDRGRGKISKMIIRKIFDALSGPEGEGGIKNAECRHEFHELTRI